MEARQPHKLKVGGSNPPSATNPQCDIRGVYRRRRDMPANIIKINDTSEFYVGDSKMPDLLKWLKENGSPENKEAKAILKETDA